MNIIFIDGVPGLGVTRWLKEIERNGKTSDVTIYPSFADIWMRNAEIKPYDMSESIRAITKLLVSVISESEVSKKNLILGGSPLAYLAFAEVTWRRVSEGARRECTAVMKTVWNFSQALLMKRWYMPFDPTKLKVLSESELENFDRVLQRMYAEHFPESLHQIQKLGNSISQIGSGSYVQ